MVDFFFFCSTPNVPTVLSKDPIYAWTQLHVSSDAHRVTYFKTNVELVWLSWIYRGNWTKRDKKDINKAKEGRMCVPKALIKWSLHICTIRCQVSFQIGFVIHCCCGRSRHDSRPMYISQPYECPAACWSFTPMCFTDSRPWIYVLYLLSILFFFSNMKQWIIRTVPRFCMNGSGWTPNLADFRDFIPHA